MKNWKNIFAYSAAPILALTAFSIIFQIWKIDLRQPIFCYGEDSLFHFFLIKNIVVSGWFFSSENIGLPHLKEIFYLHDFPLNAELFNFLIIKFFTYFSQDIFLIANCFFITSFALISAASFVALRSFNISIFSAIIVSILYAFLPYHFSRNLWHLLLSNYSIVPLLVMVSLWIASDKLSLLALNKKNQLSLAPNHFFLTSLAIGCFAAVSGTYYIFYGCVIFVFAWLLRALRVGKFFNKNGFSAIILCVAIVMVSVFIHFPTLIYQAQNGFNSQVANRDVDQSEFYALKIVNLFLPVANHYLDYFSQVRATFDSLSQEKESGSTSLGIIGSSGFLFLMLWLISKSQIDGKLLLQKTLKRFPISEKNQNLISDLASLNLLSVLFATVGGLVMLIAVPFPMFRSHARFCVFIAFFSLFAVAIIFDKIVERKIFNKKIFAKIFIVVVFVFGIFDQVGRVSAEKIQSEKIKNSFFSDREFIEKIENFLPQESAIFVLPIYTFPEARGDNYNSLVGYLHSKNLRWSYPAMAGRSAIIWQQEVWKMSFKNFINELKKEKFAGIFIDKNQFAKQHSWEKLWQIESSLKSISIAPAIVSQDLKLIFYKF